MNSDTPGRGGEGVKKGQIFADVLYGWPHRDMKISGFVDLDTADALKYVKIPSEVLIGPLRP